MEEKQTVASTSGKPGNVTNLNLYKIKKTLKSEGFEIVENPKGQITLVIRMAK